MKVQKKVQENEQAKARPTLNCPSFNELSGGILEEPCLTHFNDTWTGTFKEFNTLNEANRNGHARDATFCCLWANGMNTSYPATQHGLDDIKIFFESRYGKDKLKFWFNPYRKPSMFTRSYLSLVRLLVSRLSSKSVSQLTKNYK